MIAGVGNDELFDRARAVIPGGVDSPVRAYGSVGGTPRFLVEASGPYVTDAEGRRYVDLVASWGPALLGHAHPEVVAAVLALARGADVAGRARRDGVRLDGASPDAALSPSVSEAVTAGRDGSNDPQADRKPSGATSVANDGMLSGAPENAVPALHGGRWIGPLERVLLILLAGAGANVAVAAIIAAKGVIRFPEISKDPSGLKAEEFLIGSLTSWTLAVLGALLVVA